jgi:NADPH2:quinone reductase
VIDTERDDWADEVRADLPRGADVVLDNVGGALGRSVVPLLADGGRWSAHGTPGGSFTSIDEEQLVRHGQRLIRLTAAQLPLDRRMRLIAHGMELAAHGDLRMIVGQTFALDRAADAHTAIEGRTVFGATVLVTNN